MCGISGVFNYIEKTIDTKSILEKIVKLQHSRGPDDQGIWISKCNSRDPLVVLDVDHFFDLIK